MHCRENAWVLLVLFAGCIGPQDKPSTVHDLRVLGVQLEPPEVMVSSCGFQTLPALPARFVQMNSPVQYRALVADPAGQGRLVHYELLACASLDDETCSNGDERAVLAQGEVAPPAPQRWLELPLSLTPAGTVSQSGKAVLQSVFLEDPYHGLGGLRMPLVLHLTAGQEEIWARKLMVFSCGFFPDSKSNTNPALPGMTLQGNAWGATDVPQVLGKGPFAIASLDFKGSEESYTVASYSGSPISLRESWQLAWYADNGSFSPETTGGVDLGGQEGRAQSQWTPDAQAGEGEVQFWFVARDGRGGESWLAQRLRHAP